MKFVQLYVSYGYRNNVEVAIGIIGNTEHKSLLTEVKRAQEYMQEFDRLRVYIGKVGLEDKNNSIQATLAPRFPRSHDDFFGEIGWFEGEYPRPEAFKIAVAHIKMGSTA